MKRIKLTRGTARVSDDCPDEIIQLLDNLSRLIYMQNIEHVEFDTKSDIPEEKIDPRNYDGDNDLI